MPETVLDKSSIWGLLKLAGEEGLIRERKDADDGPLYSLMNKRLSEWHKQQILEQVILNSKIHVPVNFPVMPSSGNHNL